MSERGEALVQLAERDDHHRDEASDQDNGDSRDEDDALDEGVGDHFHVGGVVGYLGCGLVFGDVRCVVWGLAWLFGLDREVK